MKSKPHFRTRRSGFTLTELMVTIVIVAVLATIVFMGAKRGIESSRIAKNMGRLKDLGNTFTLYASEFGHYPPGWDGSYGLGPIDKNGRTKMNGRGPDLVNAFMATFELNDRWLSPNVDAKLVGYEGNKQPTNYSGHPALCYNGGDQSDPLPRAVVARPAEVFLLLDGVPKSDDDSLNSQTSVRQWYQFVRPSGRVTRNQQLPVKPTTGKERNGPDFRNRDKCHVLFCDGHVEAFGPNDFKVKHVSLNR